MGRASFSAANAIPSGGTAVYRNINAGTTGDVAKASPGRLYGWHASNATGAAAYVKVYNKATAPTQADTPVMTLAIPAGGAVFADVAVGVAFSAGISVRATTAIADNDTTAPTANNVVVNLFFA